MDIDFGKTAQDYAQHRAGFPGEFFTRIAAYGVGQAGQRVLDLGTGTGTLARGFALRGCRITGLDRSLALLGEGRRLDEAAGVRVDRLVATAERTALRSTTFDVVTAGQCWHWFDRQRAAGEVRRVLARDGCLVIAHFDWIPLPGNVVEASEQLVERFNPEWRFGGGTGLYPAWLWDVAVAGFRNIETFSFDVTTVYTHTDWRGRVRASAGVAASLTPERVAEFDALHRAMLAERFPDDPLRVPHRVFALVCRKED